ncbi:hypothetical protein NDU88_006408 [Pleurodeles waltl]|uniref:Uncharacterized protein n=1 Tax=Pleurodeles waltl TaxID=8319 RepID=A0AAV7TDE3_PLEWA|nr:hypothetical protein NDU88_006408 [Pleurodeles waltl]
MEASQGNTMEQYTTPAPLPQCQTQLGGTGDGLSASTNTEEPSRAEILAAVQGSRVALEGKIETVAVEVNLLRADLRKVSDKVKVAEGSIVEQQTEVGAFHKQMVQATSTVGRLEARLEDADGRSDCWDSQSMQRGLRLKPLWIIGLRTFYSQLACPECLCWSVLIGPTLCLPAPVCLRGLSLPIS